VYIYIYIYIKIIYSHTRKIITVYFLLYVNLQKFAVPGKLTPPLLPIKCDSDIKIQRRHAPFDIIIIIRLSRLRSINTTKNETIYRQI
jgi:hypothetical protein